FTALFFQELSHLLLPFPGFRKFHPILTSPIPLLSSQNFNNLTSLQFIIDPDHLSLHLPTHPFIPNFPVNSLTKLNPNPTSSHFNHLSFSSKHKHHITQHIHF
ncbi:hypothetical protein, partial [Bacillus pumilus]|uniref:hypothetical protein n=1 Tax=Bacillus pumilus TaxID=1408 RepID=UPI001C92EE02